VDDDSVAFMLDLVDPVSADRWSVSCNRSSASAVLDLCRFNQAEKPRPLPKLLGNKSRDRMGRDAQLHPTQQVCWSCRAYRAQRGKSPASTLLCLRPASLSQAAKRYRRPRP
jgi:hypothetical protein